MPPAASIFCNKEDVTMVMRDVYDGTWSWALNCADHDLCGLVGGGSGGWVPTGSRLAVNEHVDKRVTFDQYVNTAY
jgi:hypothetical protein